MTKQNPKNTTQDLSKEETIRLRTNHHPSNYWQRKLSNLELIIIQATTDKQSHDNKTKTFKSGLIRHLRVEISALREMCDRGEMVLQKTKIPPYNYDTDQIWLTDFIWAWFFIHCTNFSEHYKLNLVNLVLLESHSQMEY